MPTHESARKETVSGWTHIIDKPFSTKNVCEETGSILHVHPALLVHHRFAILVIHCAEVLSDDSDAGVDSGTEISTHGV